MAKMPGMDRRRKVELFEEIRRGTRSERRSKDWLRTWGAPESGAPSDRQFDPAERKTHERQRPKLDPVKAAIDGMLEGDRQVPRKQRHAAHRIWTRLRDQHPNHPI